MYFTKSKLKKLLPSLASFSAALFVGMYPLIAIYANNIQDVPLSLLWQPTATVLVANIVLFVLFNLVFRDHRKSSLIVTAIWIVFFAYGPILSFVSSYYSEINNFDSVIIPLLVVLISYLAFVLYKSNRLFVTPVKLVLMIGLSLSIFQIIKISNHFVEPVEVSFGSYLQNNNQVLGITDTHNKPDIYYIMLDSYPRSDTLKEHFKYDNSSFDDSLTQMGFDVKSKSRTNYNQTSLAIPSILNMSYIADLPEQKGISLSELMEMYKNNNTLQFVKKMGYQWINNTNYYRSGPNSYADLNIHCDSSNEFFKEVISTTILSPFKLISDQQRQDLRGDANCVLEHIDESLPGPQFTFTHILSPHPPYIFGQDGEDVSEINLKLNDATRWQAKEPFLNQLIYINKVVKDKVAAILDKSPESIIIIQSDHGTLSSTDFEVPLTDMRPVVLKERSRNYFAVYTPSYCSAGHFYDTISAVNTFRAIFNSCFNADFKILEDTIYHDSSGPTGYSGFKDITNIVSD